MYHNNIIVKLYFLCLRVIPMNKKQSSARGKISLKCGAFCSTKYSVTKKLNLKMLDFKFRRKIKVIQALLYIILDKKVKINK